MKSHLGHSTKTEHHHPEGVPPNHVIVNDLKDSPFEGKYLFNVHIILYLYFITYL
jgi:hypothetical protein